MKKERTAGEIIPSDQTRHLPTGIVNVVLNLLLVISFGLGVSGVAIATVISNVLSAGMVTVCLKRRQDEFHFCVRDMKIQKEHLMKILKIGIPAGVQGAIFIIYIRYMRKITASTEQG